MKEELIIAERHVLKDFGFRLTVEHPHKLLPNYQNALKTPPELLQPAWNYVNDAYVPKMKRARRFYARVCDRSP